jgi:glycine betaine/proline transport system ATP-binding protein
LDEALMLGHRVAIMKDGEIVQLGTPEQILREPANEYVERFVEDVDYAKVRTAESVMLAADNVAYLDEGPTVVLRRMRQAGLYFIPVVDDERRFVGMCEVEEVARLAERNERELRAAVDTTATKISRGTYLREILPHFVERSAPVAVCGEGDRLEGVVVRGSLIAGLTTTVEQNGEGSVSFDDGRPDGAPVLQGGETGRETDGRR